MDIDFTKAKLNKFKLYGGANGNKISVEYEEQKYMLKFPPKARLNPDLSYSNSCISEYVACHILQSMGMETQKTLLGTYGDKVVVACMDLEQDGFKLQEFAKLKNSIIDSEQNGYGTELEDILKTIDEQQLVPAAEMKSFFWNMFVADAFLGNFDRHNGNWGLLINENTKEAKLSPVYDCGSCLYPQMDEAGMTEVMKKPSEIEKRIYVFPTSAIHENGKKINYERFLTSTDNEDCITAIRTMYPMINMQKINKIVEDTPYISDIHKEFMKTMIKERKEKILLPAYEHAAHISSDLKRCFGFDINIKGYENNGEHPRKFGVSVDSAASREGEPEI